VKKLLVVLTLLLALPAVLVACGDDGDSDEDQVRAVIELGNNKDPAICEKLTDNWIKNVVGGDKNDCEQQVRQSKEDAVDIQKVDVNGNKATVSVKIEGESGRLLLVKENDEWKLDDVKQGG
jgi:hypothetical protein